jgi:hypothetical protein
MIRRPPNINLTIPETSYATFLCANLDWWQEALNMLVPVSLCEALAAAKARALALDERRKAVAPFTLGGERFEIKAVGSRGKEFLLENDDIRIEIGSPNIDWSITWRATAAALWEYGIHELRERVYNLLGRAGIKPRRIDERWVSLTRVDYAFDFWSPSFSKEMRPDLVNSFVSPSEVKWRADMWGKTARNEKGEVRAQTLTFGSKKGCQVQIYDKIAEVVEASGKEWMLDIWGERGGYWPTDKPADVWRLEVRMAGDWLKDRTSKDPEKFFEHQWQLIADGLFNRRLTVPNQNDSNRWRWALHPLYSLAILEIDNPQEFVPVGHKVTKRREELIDMLVANTAGTIRSALVLKHGAEFDQLKADALAMQIVARIFEDKAHSLKIERAENRYELVEEAR